MPKNFDWTTLNGVVNPSKSALVYEDVKGSFRKVAFDVYKQIGSEKLWELREENGQKFLVALYDGGDADLIVKSEDSEKKDWVATADLDKKNITLSFRSTPIAKFASSDYSFKEQEADAFAKFIEQKASDESFINALVNSMPDKKREVVVKLLQEGAI